MVLLGVDGTFKRWSLVEGFRSLGCAVKGDYGKSSLPFFLLSLPVHHEGRNSLHYVFLCDVLPQHRPKSNEAN
jgi:hypothetical protein